MAEPFRILVVCTGNICRSPMAQAMLVHGLRARLDPANGHDWYDVTSAGTHGLTGEPMEHEAVKVLDALGVTAEPFEARELIADHVESTDLVLCATRQHRAAVVSLVPRASARTFTLREFARLAEAVDLTAVADAISPADRAREIVRMAGANRGFVRADDPADDDVADPYRRPYEAFQRAGTEIRTAVDVIVDRLAPPS